MSLSPEEQDEIREEFESGMTKSAIARKHGISDFVVRRIVNNDPAGIGQVKRHHHSLLSTGEKQRLLSWPRIQT